MARHRPRPAETRSGLERRAGTRRLPGAAFLIVAGAVLLFLAVRTWVAAEIATPWIMSDELVYSELARNLAERGTFEIRGDPIAWQNNGYAALIAPAWLVTDGQAAAFDAARAINVVLGLLAVVLVYLWARRLVSIGYAVVAAGLTALMPPLLYAGTFMSENGFLPAFVLVAFATSVALERPALARQALALAAVGLACLVRVQGVILLAVLPTALLLAAAFEARAATADRVRAAGRFIVRFWPAAAASATVGASYAAVQAIRGEALLTGLGSYRSIAESDYGLESSTRWIVRHFGDLALATGVVPLSALIVLVGLALLRGTRDRAERAFLATAVAAIVWVVLQSSLFATNFSFRIQERYLFCVFPLLFIALAVWLDRSLPRRPWPLAALAAGVPAAAVLALPLRSLLGPQVLSDTFALIPLWRLSQRLSGGVDGVELLIALGATVVAVAFLALPRRVGVLLAVGVAIFLVLSSVAVHRSTRDYAAQIAAGTHGADRSWVDKALGRSQRVDYLYGGGIDVFAEAGALWQLELWNESLDDVYNIGVPYQAGIVEVKASLDRATGRLNLLPQDVPPGRFAVAAEALNLAGRRLARSGQLVLYEIDGRAQVERTTEGIHADGWTGAAASMTQYVIPRGRPRRLEVTVSRANWRGPDVPGRVVLRLGTVVERDAQAAIGRVLQRRTWTAHSGKTHVFRLRAPARPFRVELEVSPTFSPSEFGHADTRQLGVTAAFALR